MVGEEVNKNDCKIHKRCFIDPHVSDHIISFSPRVAS